MRITPTFVCTCKRCSLGKLDEAKSQTNFWLAAARDPRGIFFNDLDGVLLNEENFPNITFIDENQNHDCLVLRYNVTTSRFAAISTDCRSKQTALCAKYGPLKCKELDYEEEERDFKLDKLMNPDKRSHLEDELKKVKRLYRELFTNTDMRASYKPFFSLLWSTTLPCFPQKDEFDRPLSKFSIIKHCAWRDVPVNCADVIKMFPTDNGMCCVFNLEAANKLLWEGPYADMVTMLQERERKSAIAQVEKSMNKKAGMTTTSGKKRGLKLFLDAHSNRIMPGSVISNSNAFTATVGDRGAFPLTKQNSFLIRPGHVNHVAIRPTVVEANDDIRGIEPQVRGCSFSDETPLVMYRKYKHANCMLESQMSYALEKISDQNKCIPWFLPMPRDNKTSMCDPWVSATFVGLMDTTPDEYSSHCLPDCSTVRYMTSVTAAPFRYAWFDLYLSRRADNVIFLDAATTAMLE